MGLGTLKGAVALLTAAIVGAVGARPAVAAAPPDWQEARTEHFVVLFAPGDAALGDGVVGQVDALYAELARLVGATPGQDITLRVYPDTAAFVADNPLAVVAPGGLAYPRRARREVSVVVPADGPPGALTSVLRHELAHLVLLSATGARLPEGFQEGLAQYLAGPTEDQTRGVARLRDAWTRQRLYPWSDLAAPGAAYLDPDVTYPQARSMAQYLVDAYGLAAVTRWLTLTAESTGWRQALETAFETAPERLEAGWLAWLPSYVDGGWRHHALFTTDLSPAAALLAAGDYQGSRALLAGAGSYLAEAGPGAASQGQALLARAEAGAAAVADLERASQALDDGAYDVAAAAADSAATQFGTAADPARSEIALEVAGRARLGAAALADARRAAAWPPWRILEARPRAAQAASDLARLGNDTAAAQVRAVVAAMDRRLAPAGLLLLVAGLALLAWNGRQRRLDRAPGA